MYIYMYIYIYIYIFIYKYIYIFKLYICNMLEGNESMVIR